MSRLSRTKGANWERALARRFREMGWPDAGRNLEEVRSGNCGDLGGVKPFSVQAKCGAAPSVWRAMREAKEAADPGDYPVAIVKRDRQEALAVLSLGDFVELVSKLKTFGVL